MQERGVRVLVLRPDLCRIVPNLDTSAEDVDTAIRALEQVMAD